MPGPVATGRAEVAAHGADRPRSQFEGLSSLSCLVALWPWWRCARLRERPGSPAAGRHRAVPVVGPSFAGPGPAIYVPIDTKLRGPHSRQEWVNRPRLLSELTGTASAKLVLVDAPAGFGKTTLMTQWRSAAAEDRPVAWLSLDRGDDDPGRLWWHVVSALRQACPELGGEDILSVLAAQSPDIPGTVIPMLVNKLMGCRYRSSSCLTTIT